MHDCNLGPGCCLNTFGCAWEAVGQLTVTLKYRALLPGIEDKSSLILVVCDCDQRAGCAYCMKHIAVVMVLAYCFELVMCWTISSYVCTSAADA